MVFLVPREALQDELPGWPLTRLNFGTAANNHVPNYVFLFGYRTRPQIRHDYWMGSATGSPAAAPVSQIIIVVQVIRIDCSPVALPSRLRWNFSGTLRNGQRIGNGRLEQN